MNVVYQFKECILPIQLNLIYVTLPISCKHRNSFNSFEAMKTRKSLCVHMSILALNRYQYPPSSKDQLLKTDYLKSISFRVYLDAQRAFQYIFQVYERHELYRISSIWSVKTWCKIVNLRYTYWIYTFYLYAHICLACPALHITMHNYWFKHDSK